MINRLRFMISRLREKLWFRPLVMCLLSVLAVFVAKFVESTALAKWIPKISQDSLEVLLMTLSGSMLVIATFAVGSMVSSLASAGSSATPRTFPLVIADDVSQNALSIFIGAFIFGLVAAIFVKNEFYDPGGLSALFALTLIAFATVILTFVRWVDSIARLGRLGATVDKTSAVALNALQRRRRAPTLGCSAATLEQGVGQAVASSSVGYVQRIDVQALQRTAEESDVRIAIRALPGTFAAPDSVLAHVIADDQRRSAVDLGVIEEAFVIGDRRTFDEDPRFGLVVLSEIAARALSPAVNDPGTAIDIIGVFVRLFAAWAMPVDDDERRPCVYDRLEVPELSAHDMFDDAFTAIARDGAGSVEVAARLQKALRSLSLVGDPEMRDAAMEHSQLALERATHALTLPKDLDTIRALAGFSSSV